MATGPKGDAAAVRSMVVRDLARKVAGFKAGAGTTTDQVASRRKPLSVRHTKSIAEVMRR
jgi:hypothetical protein